MSEVNETSGYTYINQAAATNFASDEAERSFIGCIVTNFEECAGSVAELTENDFYYEKHRVLFRAIKQAKAEQLDVNLVTVDQMLEKSGIQDAWNYTQDLVDCTQFSVGSWQCASLTKIIKELSTRRKAIELVGQIGNQLKDPTQGINAIMDKLRTDSGDLTIGKHSWATMQDVLLNTYMYLENRVKGDVKSITTGIPNVDAVIGGFFGGEMTIIGARPAVGKSVFGMNVALAAAAQGFKVGILSREMTDIQYGQRIISYAAHIDGMKIRKAEIADDDWGTIVDGISVAARLPVEFLFTVRTVEDLRAEVQRKVNRHEIDMLIVDYLQLMTTDQRFKEDRLRVGHISKSLKDMAVDFNIPVIALAQVKRYAGGARAKMPTLEDLKDSGNLEQDADGVIFLHNPYDEEDEYIDPRDKPYFRNFAEAGFTYLCLGIAKQRQGSTGKACVLFDKKTMRYRAIDRSGQEAE